VPLFIAGELAGALVGREGIDNIVEITGEHLLQPIDREPDAMVGDSILFVVIGADLLAAATTTDL
jgi:hypothetical protein